MVLDGRHAPHAADDEGAVAQEAGRAHGGGRTQAWMELHAVDAIADVRHLRGRRADGIDQPLPQVFAMHAQAHAGQAGQQLRLEAAKVARVHDCRAQLLQYAVQLQVVAPVLAFALAQADDIDTRRSQALAKCGGVLQTDDGVPVAFRRQMVDQVDQAIFQPAHVELVDHVHDQRGAVSLPCAASSGVKGHAATPASVVR
jgi:hypothetical protein